MSNNPLKVIASENNSEKSPYVRHGYPGKQSSRIEAQAKFDRMWLTDPEQFNPLRNCMERERIALTWELLQKHFNIAGKRVVDLGCSDGTFSRMMHEAGASVDAVDISSNAIKHFKQKGTEGITVKHDYVPHTLLDDDTYDLVLSLDLIAYINRQEHRLFISELSRLVKSTGIVVCSTPIDIYSDDALDKFTALVDTEFDLLDIKASHHGWLIKIKNFFEAPHRFVIGSHDKEYRNAQLKSRRGLNRLWYKLNSTKLCSLIWRAADFLFRPIVHFLKQNRTFMLGMEKIAKFVSAEGSISHAIVIAKRRPIMAPIPKAEIPEHHRGKKQIWE